MPRGGATIAAATLAHASFEPNAQVVGSARRFVRERLLEWRADEVMDDTVLLVSELVTNAIVHAGTALKVTCQLSDGSVQVRVEDRYPARGLPDGPVEVDVDSTGGRGLALTRALASAWGVTYTPTAKEVWFRLDLPGRPDQAGTAFASPIGASTTVPAMPDRLDVAVVRADADGRIWGWNDEAVALLGWTAEQAGRRTLADLFSCPSPGEGSLALAEVMELSRWQGECDIRHSDGHLVPAFASHLRTLGEDGKPALVWLIVHASHRAVLEVSYPPPAAREAESDGDDAGEDLVILSDAFATRLTLDELLQRTAECVRAGLEGDAAYVLLAADDARLEVRATAGLPSELRQARVPVEGVLERTGASRLPTVHDDLGEQCDPAPLLRGTGMRALVTVPLLVEGRVTGVMGAAARAPGTFDNDDAVRLQRAADRIALSLERARLAELERSRRGWLSFLAESSELLAGVLDQDKALALVAQLVVPRLATWCALHTVDEKGRARLGYVWHADEAHIDALRSFLAKVPPPEQRSTPGARSWRELETLAGDAAPAGDRALSFPLVARGRSLGTLTLGRPGDEDFPSEMVELAGELSRHAALSLDNARLYSEQVSTSRALQRSLLPPDVPDVAGIDLAVVYQPAGTDNEVGGDFYDVFAVDDKTWRFAIGDVCGTGPEAAAVTGLARHTLRLLARERYAVPTVLERLNTAILDEGPRSQLLTVLYGEISTREEGGVRLTLASAGHPLPLRLRPSGEVDAVASPQPLLGVMAELDFEVDTVDLEPGDVLLCVTDGVTERRGDDRLLDDEGGLAELLAGCTGLTAGAVAARVERAVEGFAATPPSDDMAMLVLRAL